MDSDDIDSEFETQNETNEDILFGFTAETDEEFSGIVQLEQEMTDSESSDSEFQLEDGMQTDDGDTDR